MVSKGLLRNSCWKAADQGFDPLAVNRKRSSASPELAKVSQPRVTPGTKPSHHVPGGDRSLAPRLQFGNISPMIRRGARPFAPTKHSCHSERSRA
jgi:hypothetical protein